MEEPPSSSTGLAEIAGEGDRDVRSPEGRHDIEASQLQVSDPEETERRQPLELVDGQVVNLGIAPRVVAESP